MKIIFGCSSSNNTSSEFRLFLWYTINTRLAAWALLEQPESFTHSTWQKLGTCFVHTAVNLCYDHIAYPTPTTLIPPAAGSEVGVSLLAETFYQKLKCRQSEIWETWWSDLSLVCVSVSDVLWLSLSKSEHSCCWNCSLCWQVMVNQQSEALQQWRP